MGQINSFPSTMATVNEATKAPLTGYNHIDALLDNGPGWNYVMPSAGNVISYTFSTASGMQAGNNSLRGAPSAFTFAQQAATRDALAYVSQVTGIRFQETGVGTDAQVHFSNADLTEPQYSGLCSWNVEYSYMPDNQLADFKPGAYIYLDNVQWGSQNASLNGGQGGETLLHEIGHMLGLKHPFEGTIQLPLDTDSTAYTLMSYTDAGGPYMSYSPYDIAALNWLYGGDGLGGALGINSVRGGRYLTGTAGADTLTAGAANDKLEGGGGNDVLAGGAGIDSAYFAGGRAGHSVAVANGVVTVTDLQGSGGTDTLSGVERLNFGGASYAVDIAGNGGKAYRIYQAAFDRAPDSVGLGFWLKALDDGVTLRQVANDFIGSPEFGKLYGTNVSNFDFITRLYSNILHRTPDQSGFNFWLDALNGNVTTRDAILADFSESPENQAQVLGTIQNGFEYTPYG